MLLKRTIRFGLLFCGVALLPAASPAQAQSGDAVYEAADLTTMPKMTSVEKAARLIEDSYPERLRSAKVGGTVKLAIVIGVDGKVEPGSVQVITSTQDELGEAAKKVVEKLMFTPGKVKETPVRARVILPIAYRPA